MTHNFVKLQESIIRFCISKAEGVNERSVTEIPQSAETIPLSALLVAVDKMTAC